MSEKIRVVIATTEGPAEVERLSEEDPTVQSVVCLQGKAIALPVSADYDAFVRRPTGVIEAAYGHPAYRLDLAAPVTGGLSWQLGALTAHALHAEVRLAGRGETPGRVLWLTGEVDRDLKVLPVEHLTEKLRASAALFRRLASDGVPVTLCLPQANLAELEDGWIERLGLSAYWISILGTQDAREVLGHLDLAAPTSDQVPQALRPADDEAAMPRRARLAGFGLIACVGLAALLYGFKVGSETQGPASEALALAPAQAVALELKALETRAPEGGSCAAVITGAMDPVRRELPIPADGRQTSFKPNSLCRLHYRATNQGAPVKLWLVGARGGEQAEELHTKTFFAGQPLETADNRTFEVALPRRFDQTLVQTFVLIARPEASVAAGETNEPVVGDLKASLSPAAWDAWLEGLKAHGYSVQRAEHALAP